MASAGTGPAPQAVSDWRRAYAWFVALRRYLPRPEVVDARWQCPPITRVG
ncbi:hypothetical protein [Streptomyces sp. MAI_2237]